MCEKISRRNLLNLSDYVNQRFVHNDVSPMHDSGNAFRFVVCLAAQGTHPSVQHFCDLDSNVHPSCTESCGHNHAIIVNILISQQAITVGCSVFLNFFKLRGIAVKP